MQPKLVLANGVFDIFHIGHVRHLKAARKLGDVLIVSLTKDRSVGKGPGRPVFGEKERAEMLEPYCDSTILVDDALEALQKIDPDVFVKGPDYVDRIEPEHAAYCKARGIKIVFTKEPKYSSSALIDRLRQS